MIAYIDDNQDCLEIIKELFLEEGIKIDTYDSPIEFPFDKVKDYKLVISDFNMPVNGQDFLDLLKNEKIKKVIYSGEIENIKYERSLHIDAFLEKPLDSKLLVKTVKYLSSQK